MKYIRLSIILTGILFVLPAFCQTQKGYVKTKGRLNENGQIVPGKRLSGAAISLKSRNAVLSNSNGDFTLKLAGNAYILQSVKKEGYVLTDVDALSKQYAYSSENPHIIVMETLIDQADDRMIVNEKMRASLGEKIRKLQTEVKKLKAEKKISDEEYSRKLKELEEQRSSNEKLIEEMVKRYSQIDYDQLDEFNRQVSALILNGELMKADSLINTKGDITQQAVQYLQKQKHILARQEEINNEQQTLDKAKQLSQQELNDLAERCYSKFEVFKLQHKNDSAGYYIELRASLDTLNVAWLCDAADFLFDYLSNYDKALTYYQRHINIGICKYGKNSYFAREAYRKLGYKYITLEHFSEAIASFEKVLEIEKKICSTTGIASTYIDLGNVYGNHRDYDKAINYYNMALKILGNGKTYKDARIAAIYNNIGVRYHSMNSLDKAYEYHKKALDIILTLYGENNDDAILYISNLGLVSISQGDYKKALEFYKKGSLVSTKNL